MDGGAEMACRRCGDKIRLDAHGGPLPSMPVMWKKVAKASVGETQRTLRYRNSHLPHTQRGSPPPCSHLQAALCKAVDQRGKAPLIRDDSADELALSHLYVPKLGSSELDGATSPPIFSGSSDGRSQRCSLDRKLD